jgi:3-oxoadipate enol-lactonase
MAWIEAAGGRLEVFSTGEGSDLVLLHSLLIDRSAFDGVVPHLARTRRVHVVALPGFDGSTPAGPEVSDYADRIADALKRLPLRPGAALLGNGFGGFIAISLAARHADLVDALLLVDTAACFPAPARAAFAVVAEKVTEGGMAAVAEIAARRIFHDAYLSAHPEAVAERRAVLMRFDPAAFIAACRALERVNLRAALPRINQKTLVLVGELDAATPVALARELAESIGGARFVLLPQCGHCPPLEQPDAFLSAVGRFLGVAAG